MREVFNTGLFVLKGYAKTISRIILKRDNFFVTRHWWHLLLLRKGSTNCLNIGAAAQPVAEHVLAWLLPGVFVNTPLPAVRVL
jgi:hypothetical protein